MWPISPNEIHFIKCYPFLQTWPILSSVTYFSKCDPFSQVFQCSNINTLTRSRDLSAWHCFSNSAVAFISFAATVCKRERYGFIRLLCLLILPLTIGFVKYWSFNEHNSYNYIELMADTISKTSESYATTCERATLAPRLHAGVNTPQGWKNNVMDRAWKETEG